MGITRLMKLLYLCEAYHRLLRGRAFGAGQFVRYQYGPFCAEVYPALRELEEAGVITTRTVPRIPDGRLVEVTPARGAQATRMSAEREGTVERVLRGWGSATRGELIDFVYRTKPFLETEFGEAIDLRGLPYLGPDAGPRQCVKALTNTTRAPARGLPRKTDELVEEYSWLIDDLAQL